MKKIYTSIFSTLFLFAVANAQIFWTENFGTGCSQGTVASSYTGTNGAWTLSYTGTNDNYANQWYVSATEAGMGVNQCGNGCLSNPNLTNRTLHVSNVAVTLVNLAADQGAAYNTGGVCQSFQICVITNIRAESPIIDCTSKAGITLSFLYMENGQGSTDNATLVYSQDGGLTWVLLQDLAKTQFGNCSPQGMWTSYSIALPLTANYNPLVKIGFNWTNNDDGVGTDPSFAVDDITLSTVPTSVNEYSDAQLNVFNDGNYIVIQSPEMVKLIAMYDMLGKQVNAQLLNNKIAVNELVSGVYFIQIEVAGKIITRKIKI